MVTDTIVTPAPSCQYCSIVGDWAIKAIRIVFSMIVVPIMAASTNQSDRKNCSLSILISANQIRAAIVML
jgi:hypothetical protein